MRHTAARVLALIVALAAVLPATAEDVDDLLGGFEEEESAEPAEDPDEADLGGFDDATPAESVQFETSERFWDLTGSVVAGSSIAYHDHNAGDGRNYQGLVRMRTRLNLQLDLELPKDWELRLGGYGFYDWTYLMRGRNSYQSDVLDDYEWEADFQEVWVRGSPVDNLDVKVGRQIVNWGRSDTLRVLDVLNPLDNREPGRTDIEDLRWPVTMVRTDYYWKDWSFTAIAIPEMRFSTNPPFGNDFGPKPGPGTLLPQLSFGFGILPEDKPNASLSNTGWAGAAKGIFHGWDISFHAARYAEDRPHLQSNFKGYGFTPAEPTPRARLRYSRVTLLGSGANYTIGSWLFKGELAFIEGAKYPIAEGLPTPVGTVLLPTGTVDKNRLDTMAGIEYFGISDVTIALEVANRHIFEFDRRMTAYELDRNAVETALRITGDFLNERLETTLLGIAFGVRGENGAALRAQAAYDIRDALVFTGGILLYKEGDLPNFETIGRNDRIFLELKYSF